MCWAAEDHDTHEHAKLSERTKRALLTGGWTEHGELMDDIRTQAAGVLSLARRRPSAWRGEDGLRFRRDGSGRARARLVACGRRHALLGMRGRLRQPLAR